MGVLGGEQNFVSHPMDPMMVGEKKKTALILAFSPRRRNRCSRFVRELSGGIERGTFACQDACQVKVLSSGERI